VFWSDRLSRDADREEAPPHAGRALISTWLMVTETAQRPLGSGRRSMQAPDAMRTQLYGIAAFDPATLAGVAIVIGATAWIRLLAAGASRVDPVVALRYEDRRSATGPRCRLASLEYDKHILRRSVALRPSRAHRSAHSTMRKPPWP
jgi:hypothetical protein